MPQVPQYGPSPRVDAAPTRINPQQGQPAGLFSTGAREQSAVGQAFTNTGDTMARVAVDIQTRDNADQVFRTETAIRDEYMGYEQEAKNKLGADAKGLTKQTQEWWDAAVTKHSDALENDAQRRLFNHQVTPLRQSSIDMLSTHEGVQRRKSLVDSASADAVSATNMAAANPYDENVLATSRATIERNVGVVSQLNGWTKEQYDAALGEKVSKMHEGVIGAMVDKDPKSATAYYETHKNEIEGTQHAQLEKTLEIGGIRERTQNYATDIISRASNQGEALKIAETELSGLEEDETVQRINAHYNQQRSTREASQKDASDQAWDIAMKGGMNAIPAATIAAMDGRAVLQMQDYFRARQNQNEADIVTDYAKYSELMSMAATDPAKFLEQNPNEWRNDMNTQDWNTLRGVYNQVLTAKGKPPPNLMTANSIADSYINQTGLSGPQNKQHAGYVKTELLGAMAAAQAAQPDKHLSDAQLTVAADVAYKALVDRGDPRLTVTPAPAKLTAQNRMVAQYVANVLEAKNSTVSGRLLTSQQNTFKTLADEVLADKRRKNGGELTEDQMRRTLDFLMRKGQIEGSGYIRDDRGYYFEFLGRPDVKNFKADTP